VQRPGDDEPRCHPAVAERRDAVPATVEGTEHGDHLGVLRFDFGGDSERLQQVSWQEWFETFDARRLNFLYQEERKDGRQSNFFRFESPDREGRLSGAARACGHAPRTVIVAACLSLTVRP
jgi:hypothetical protein